MKRGGFLAGVGVASLALALKGQRADAYYNATASPGVPVCYETRTFSWRQYLTTSVGSDLGGTSRVWFNPIGPFQQFRLLFTNIYEGNAGGETNLPGSPGTITISATVEDPTGGASAAGAPAYGVFFGGQTSVAIPLNGWIFSDPIDLDVNAQNEVLWVRTYVQCPSGNRFPCNTNLGWNSSYPTGYGYNANDSTAIGTNYVQDGGTGSNNLTTTGTAWIVGTGQFLPRQPYGPVAVIGQLVSTAPRVVMMNIGDSRALGFGDSFFGELGEFERAMRASGIANISVPGNGEQAFTMFGNQTFWHVRRTLAQMCTHAIYSYGINDINGSVALATLKTEIIAGVQLLVNRGIKVYAATIEPFTSGTFTSAGAQTIPSTPNEAVRVGLNTLYRTWAPGSSDPLLGLLSGVYDVAATIEVNASNVFTLNGGRWYAGVGNNTAFTTDGLHGASNACALMQVALTTAGINGTAPVQSLTAPSGGAVGTGSSPPGAIGNG